MANKWKVCTQTACWYDDLFGAEAGADAAMAFIKNCGFDAVDYNIDHTLSTYALAKGEKNTFYDASVEELQAFFQPLKEASEKHDVAIAMAHAPFPMAFEGKDAVNDYIIMAVEKIIAIMGYLNCPALVVHPVVRDDKQVEWETNLSIYRRLMPAARKYGVTICLENMFTAPNGHILGGACSDANEACRYIDLLNEEAGAEVFGYCFDIGHANLTSRHLYNDLVTLGKRLTVLHIHDNDSVSDLHLLPYTQKRSGAVDWDGFIRGLRDAGYEGPLDFETFAGVGLVPKELTAAALKFISEVGRYFVSKLA